MKKKRRPFRPLNGRFNPYITQAPIEEYTPIYELARDPEAIILAIASLNKPLRKHIVDAVIQTVREGRTHYTSTWGEPELRREIARKLLIRNKISADPDREILVTMGAGHGFMMAVKAFVKEGDEVITPDPSFPLNFGVTTMCGGKPISVTLRQGGKSPLSVDKLRKKVSEKTKMIILVSPENPTGIVYPRSALEEIAEIARDNDIVVLSDEVYENMVFDGVQTTSMASIKGMKDLTISIYSFSKEYDLSGFRIGYIVASHETLYQIYKIQRNDGASACSVSQMAALAALKGPQDYLKEWLSELDRKRRAVLDALNALPGVECAVPKAGCYVFPDISEIGDDQELYEYLAKKVKVGVTPGRWYGAQGRGHIRICYGAVTDEKLMEGLRRIRAALLSFQGRESNYV